MMTNVSSSTNPAFLSGVLGAKLLANSSAKSMNLDSAAPKKGSFTAGSSRNPKKRALSGGFVKGQNKQPKLASRSVNLSGLSDARTGKANNERHVEQINKGAVVEADRGIQEEKEMEREVENLKAQLNRSKEKTNYWRRKSLDLQTVLADKKSSAKKSISALEEKVEEMTDARISLQKKLAEDTATNEQAMDELAGLLDVQLELEKDKELLLKEMEVLQSSCQEAKEARWAQIDELQSCLRETLGDLKDKLGELTMAKEALKRAKRRLTELQKLADESRTKEDAVASVDGELQDKCDRREQRVSHLTDLVEKLVFKASVLSQTNSELKAKMEEGAVEASAKAIEPALPKMDMLEKMCLKRYSKIMKQAGQRMFDHKQALVGKSTS